MADFSDIAGSVAAETNQLTSFVTDPANLSTAATFDNIRSAVSTAQSAIQTARDLTGAVKTAPSWQDGNSNDSRLFLVQPRSADAYYRSSKGSNIYDRGNIAAIKLLTNDSAANMATSRAVTGFNLKEDYSSLTAGTYSKFFVTDVQVRYDEKTQITTTFGDGEVVYYFGRNPPVFSINGLLFDSLQNDWFGKTICLYGTTLRGTQLAKNFELVELTLNNMRIVGSISNLSVAQNANRDTDIQFSMQFIAKEVVPLPVPDSGMNLAVTGSTKLIDFSVGQAGVGGAGWGMEMSSVSSIAGGLRAVTSTVGDLSRSLGQLNNSKRTGNVGAFRSSIFSPVYGILTTISRVLKSSGGDTGSVIADFTSNVASALKTVSTIAGIAGNPVTALINISQNPNFPKTLQSLTSNVSSIANSPVITKSVDFVKTTVASMNNTAGIVATAPVSGATLLQSYANSGNIASTSPIMSYGVGGASSKVSLMSSSTIPLIPTGSSVESIFA